MPKYTKGHMPAQLLALSPQLLRFSQRLSRRLVRPAEPPPFDLTRRDVDILTLVERFRFLTSEQVVRLLRVTRPGTSHQRVLRRLNGLFAHGLLDRPRHQALYVGPCDPIVYGLAPGGVRLISGNPVRDRRSVFAAKKNDRVTAALLLHTLETAETMIGFEAEAARSGLILLDRSALRPYLPPATRKSFDPFLFRVQASYAGRKRAMTLKPDRIFSIAGFPDNTRLNFALELDRASEQIAPAERNPRKSTIARKLACYEAAWRAGLFQTQLAFDGMRVLFVTTTGARVRAMLAEQRKLLETRLARMFLYTTVAAFNEAGPLGAIWSTIEAEGVSLLPARS